MDASSSPGTRSTAAGVGSSQGALAGRPHRPSVAYSRVQMVLVWSTSWMVLLVWSTSWMVLLVWSTSPSVWYIAAPSSRVVCCRSHRAIMQYLMNKYATEETQYLYPKEPEERAKVDRMLFFDMGTLYHAIKEYFGPRIHQGMPPDQDKENLLKTSLDYLDHFLEIGGVPYLCGERITIADIAILASITELDALKYSYKCYGELFRWSERVKENIPCYKECCIEGVEMTRARVKQLEDDLKKQMEKERKASITKK